METTSFAIASYCVPCRAHCRYCLLASPGQTCGVDYARSERFARRVLEELGQTRPGLSAIFYIGYCMDTPHLRDFIRFSGEHGGPGARFLQMNGFAFRDDRELASLMGMIRGEGVETVDLTFYGTEAFHDRFAGREGDFRFLTRMLSAAGKAGLAVHVSMPLMRDNLDQAEELCRFLDAYPVAERTAFLPHTKGRGRDLAEQRITKAMFDRLPERVRGVFARTPHRTEAEWIAAGDWEEPARRNLTLVLTGDRIDALEAMSAEEILASLEALDDRFLAEMPSARELARRYGDPDGSRLFRRRDLILLWQQRFLAETGGALYDMHDETHSFSVHT
ncbi:MAG: hypothetical protein IJK28_00580 [Clostridia bacterium]|nr:hypothetical protein [Clostridia bacterium]